MRNLKRSLYLLPVLMLALLAYSPLPAQDAPEGTDEKPESKPVLLTADEVAMWQAWIRGDLKGCYSKAQQMLESPELNGAAFDIALELQARSADELGWHEAHARDLKVVAQAHETGGHLARWKLIEREMHLGDTRLIEQLASELGFIRNWWMLGPFTNDRGQGFEDVLEPELGLEIDSAYSGKEGQAVELRRLPVQAPDGTIDIGAMLRPNEAAAAYLVTAVWCDERQRDAEFRIGSDGPVKGGLLAPSVAELDEGSCFRWFGEFDKEREIGFDQDHFKISRSISEPNLKYEAGLQAGWNVVVFKCGVDDRDWRVRIRLLHADGVRFAATTDDLEAALSTAPEFAEGEWSETGKGATPDATVDVHVGRAPYEEAARELLLPALDRSSSLPRRRMQKALDACAETPVGDNVYAVLSYLAAWANRSSASYSAGREENRRRELLKQCLELDPKAARAALELSQYYTTTFSNPALADEYAQAAVKANPAWVEARIYASRVVLMKGLDIEVERELAKLLQEFPEDANVLRFSAYYAGLRRDYKLSNDLFEKALKADFADAYSRARLLERATSRGDMQTALKLAVETRKLDPFDTSVALQLADMFMNSEKYSLGERELKKALEIAPRDDELIEKLAQVYSAWADASEGDKAKELRERAVETYVDALDANPKREDIERYLEFLEGEQPPFEAALQEDVSERIEAALVKEVDGDDPYEVVYRDEIVVVNEDGTTSQYIQQVYRVTNDNGRDWLQRLSVPAYSDQQGRCVEACVYRADGDIEEGRRSRWSASFPPLEIGDVVQVRFRVTDRTQSFFGDFFGVRKTFMDYVPVQEVRYVWVLPPGRSFHEYLTAGAPPRVETAVNGHKVWSYRAVNLPKLYDEPLAPPSEQRSPTVQLSTYGNWNEFGRWYYNLIRKQMEATPEMTAKVNELTKGLQTEKEKARAVYNWVVTEVRYNADWHFGVHGYKPFSAGAVFARCIGDCKDKAILICTMLRIAGVTAWPVITNLDNFRGDEDITLPMPDHFNHAIAYIEYSNGTSQFVDGTATYNGIDELPSADRGANCIIVRPDGGERTQIPWGDASGDLETDDIDAEFAPEGTLKLKVKRTAVGDSASGLRQRYEKEGDRKKQLEREWSEYFPGAKVSDIRVNDLSDIDLSPEINFTVELPNAYTTKDGAIEFRLALDPREWTQTSFASLTTRRTDLLTPAPFQRRSVVRFALPPGYKAKNLGVDVKEIESPHVRFVVSASQADGTLTVTRDYSILGGTVTVSEYPAFRRKLIAYDTAEATTIKLTK
ncbi:MAG: DUF3857 domain-containing protein [Planctomycetota bacterium]